MSQKMRELKNEIEKEQEQNTQQEQQQKQQKKPKYTLYIFINNRKPEKYDSSEWTWTYESETIRGYIREYGKAKTDIALFKYTTLSILKKDKTQLILISGNYTAKEIFERE
jgi:hypothetical protein